MAIHALKSVGLYERILMDNPSTDNGWRICGEQFAPLPESNRFNPPQPVVRARNMRLLCVTSTLSKPKVTH